ncbi:hypothetical protein BDZ97DRAFT_1768630 [Flammula alnicola]|nr:hypothetical protein BDZ97DRAFT_1768630 [Flammula alnicola]
MTLGNPTLRGLSALPRPVPRVWKPSPLRSPVHSDEYNSRWVDPYTSEDYRNAHQPEHSRPSSAAADDDTSDSDTTDPEMPDLISVSSSRSTSPEAPSPVNLAATDSYAVPPFLMSKFANFLEAVHLLNTELAAEFKKKPLDIQAEPTSPRATPGCRPDTDNDNNNILLNQFRIAHGMKTPDPGPRVESAPPEPARAIKNRVPTPFPGYDKSTDGELAFNGPGFALAGGKPPSSPTEDAQNGASEPSICTLGRMHLTMLRVWLNEEESELRRRSIARKLILDKDRLLQGKQVWIPGCKDLIPY